jgi:hypothetical protein
MKTWIAMKVDCTPLPELSLRPLRRATTVILRAERFQAKRAAAIHGAASMRVVAKQLIESGSIVGVGCLNEHFSKEGLVYDD